MRCPHCGSFDDKVIESRTLANGDSIRRRRECIACGYRFTSYERIEEKQFMVIKRDGRRQPFERVKLEHGIERALEKRPFSAMTIENIVNEIEDLAVMTGKTAHEIPSTVLGELVLEQLYKMDKVAYIRFASVYRHFDNLEEFIQEAKKVGGEDGSTI
jgi:transcriptional repressor NrdR